MKRILHNILNITAALYVIAAMPCSLMAAEPKVPDRPNIILIMVDDLGYGELGCYGNTDIKTPNIDRLADEGIRMMDFCVAGAVCTPSRSALLTGRYPQRNGLYDLIRNNEINYGHKFNEIEYAISPEMTLGLDLREITIAQLLQNAGYATGIVGKWDSGRARRFMPLQRGFDSFYGFSNTGIDYWTHERYGVPSMFRGNERIKEEGYATNLFRREAVRFIKENKDRPFFLYVAFNSPHSASNLHKDKVQAPENYIRIYGDPPGTKKMRHLANITCMDDAVGEILNTLDEFDLGKNTLVIFTSDHGAGSIGNNGPLRGGKGQLYEGGIRVPFIARWPGQIPDNSVSHEFCSMMDLFPTFLTVAGENPPSDIKLDGYNILPVLTEGRKAARNEHFWEWHDKLAARSGNWKWVRETDSKRAAASDEVGELYDLSNDIGEQRNLASERPDVLKEMKAKWNAWKKEMDEAEPRGPFRNY